MDPEVAIDDADSASSPLLEQDSGEPSSPIQSNRNSSSLDDTIGGLLGGSKSGLEQGENDSTILSPPQKKKIPTLWAFIMVPMLLFLVGTFLAAAFMPHTQHEQDQNSTTNDGNSSNPHENLVWMEKLHEDPIAPTLLSIRDHDGSLLNVKDHELYKQLKEATFHYEKKSENMYVLLSPDSVSAGSSNNHLRTQDSSNKIILKSNKAEIGYGDELTLTWDSPSEEGVDVNDEDVLALYCPAGDKVSIRNFRDAATIAQVRATHAHYNRLSNKKQQKKEHNVWTIPSFPIIREETCEFRLFSHHRNEGPEEGRVGDDGNGHYYTQMANTKPITSTSNQKPTGIHLGLTGKASEMYIQFSTGDSGEPLVEIAKKSDIHINSDLRTPTASMVEMRGLAEDASSVSWTKLKGTSTTYAATEMCQEPATSTDPGNFVSPGHLHTVKVTNLEPHTEYVYRVGLGFGQGVKWGDKYREFHSSPPPGTRSPSPSKPALTFLALADQGCPDPNQKRNHDHSQNVTQLIISLINNQTIDSVHHPGDLSYANGAAHLWDVWTDMIEPYASHVPLMVGVGNHEYDHSKGGGDGKDPSGVKTENGFQPSWGNFGNVGGECGVPVSKRFAVPDNGNGVFWYSYEQSLVHTVMISSEHNMTAGSEQHIWLKKDLAAVNRTITPWIVVEIHRPLYHAEIVHRSTWKDSIVSIGLQDEIEDLLHTNKVDLVLSGHLHSYFRSCDGLYYHKCNNGGPTYITVGTGGAPLDGNADISTDDYTEMLYKQNWGVGRASVFNESHLLFEFVEVGGTVIDAAWITRDRS